MQVAHFETTIPPIAGKNPTIVVEAKERICNMTKNIKGYKVTFFYNSENNAFHSMGENKDILLIEINRNNIFLPLES